MPEEEIEYLDDDNNGENNNISSSISSSKNNESNIIDFNKYRSRKNKSANINNDKKGSNSSNTSNLNLPIRNRLANGIKNQISNGASRALSNVASANPVLGTLGALNNIRKNIAARKNSTAGSLSGGVANGNNDSNNTVSASDDTKKDNTSSVSNNENSSEVNGKSFNPLSSIFGSKNGISGRFSFFGKLSLPLKLATILAPVFLIFFIILIPISVISLFSSFLGMNEVIASEGSISGNIDYGDYELSSDGNEILHESLDSFLQSKGSSLEEFNNLIASNVENSGYGTDAGVVAAAVTLIAELGNNYDVKIPYFWGGGHGQMITGAEGNWGSNQCRASANGRIYDYCGLDCSGFVAWAIWNGGFNIAARVTGQFQALPGAERVSLNSSSAVLAPGDLLESNSHIVLVVGVDEETNEYICAEASGYTTGVLFTRRPFSRSGYWGVKMAGFYERQVRS